MKPCVVALLALGAMGFQSRASPDRNVALPNSLGVSRFPIGTYASCAQGTHNPSGNNFLNAAGFQDGAVLALTQSGSTLTSSYIDPSGVTRSLTFSTTTATTATLTQKGQVIPGFAGLCVLGPGNQSRYPASLTVNAGTLAYNGGAVFLAVTGNLRSDAGACGTLSQPRASFWVLCEDRQGGALRTIDAGPRPVSRLQAGEYMCRTQVESFDRVNGLSHYVAGGGNGTLALTADGSRVTCRYSGDRSFAGTLRFDATTPTTAVAGAGQTVMAPCMVPLTTGVLSQTPEPLPIATAALTLTDSTLFLSFAGTTAEGSSCRGAKVAGSLICSR